MFSLLSNLSVALRGYLSFYMPTNRAVDWLRTPRGLKWAIPVALIAMSSYLFATSVCAAVVERGGPGCFNILVILFFWNAVKFAWLGVLAPLRVLSDLMQQTPCLTSQGGGCSKLLLSNVGVDPNDQGPSSSQCEPDPRLLNVASRPDGRRRGRRRVPRP